MTDEEIRQALEVRDLREAYLVEVAVQLGFDVTEGWTEAAFNAIESASMDVRRAAALHVIELDVRLRGES
jgi:hypothetical protein